MMMRLVEIDEGALDLIQTGLDAIRFGKAGSSSKMDIAKANPPKGRDNRSRNRRGTSGEYDHLTGTPKKCGKWDDPKTTGCVRK